MKYKITIYFSSNITHVTDGCLEKEINKLVKAYNKRKVISFVSKNNTTLIDFKNVLFVVIEKENKELERDREI